MACGICIAVPSANSSPGSEVKAGSCSLQSLAPHSQVWSTNRKRDTNTLLQVRNANSQQVTPPHMSFKISVYISPSNTAPSKARISVLVFQERKLGTEGGLATQQVVESGSGKLGRVWWSFLINLPYFPALECDPGRGT